MTRKRKFRSLVSFEMDSKKFTAEFVDCYFFCLHAVIHYRFVVNVLVGGGDKAPE